MKPRFLTIALLFCLATPAYALDVTLQWDANTESDLAGYKVYYKAGSSGGSILANYNGTGAYEGNSPIDMPLALDENPDPDIVEFTVTDLPDGQTYYFVVTAYNDDVPPLESGPSNEENTTAPPSDTTPPYATNRSPAPGATGVAVDTLIALELRDAGVGVDQSSIFMRVNGSQVTPSISGTTAAYTLSYNSPADFAYDQTVSVEVDASDLNGNTMATDFYSFTTAAPSDTSPPVISNVQATSITEASAVITWTTDEVSDSEVQYGTSSGTWGSYAHNGNDGSTVTNHSVTLTGLNPGTTYFFRIGSTDGSGNGPTTSDELSFITDLGSGTISEVFGDVSGADYTGTCEDTYSNVGQATVNFYADSLLRTYTWPTNTVANRTIMKWDLSAILAGATIQNATLSLYMDGTEGTGGDDNYEISVHRIINHDPVVASCTWNTYDGVNSWTGGSNGGAQDLATPESTAVVDKTAGYKSWNITQMVQQWVNAPSSNFGLMLNSDSNAASDSNRYFSSSDDSNPDQRPKLTITYAPPAADTTPPVISNVQASPITDTTAVITWTTDEVSDSEVQFGTSSTNWGSYQHSSTSGTLVTSHSVTLTGLNDDTTYFFRVGSTDGFGNGPTISNELGFTTDPTPDTTAPTISNVQVTSITETTAIISWTTNEPSDSEVQYDSASRLWGSYPWGENDDSLVTSHSITLTGLNASTTYYFSVGSTDGSGNGPTTSNEMTFTTEAAPSPIPPNSPTGLNIIRAE